MSRGCARAPAWATCTFFGGPQLPQSALAINIQKLIVRDGSQYMLPFHPGLSLFEDYCAGRLSVGGVGF